MKRDFVVSFLSSVPGAIRGMFEGDPVLVSCPVSQSASGGYPGGRDGYRKWIQERIDGDRNVMPGIARQAGVAPANIGRVCVMGFSNGCIGVDEMLKCNDAFKYDTVLAIDGIHGQLSWDGQLQPPLYKSFMNFAAYAAQRNPEVDPDAPVMVVTHSSIGQIMKREPSGRVVAQSPSTTETADAIWRQASTVFPPGYLSTDCGYGCLPNMHVERIMQQYAAPVEACSHSKCYPWMGIQDGWYDRRGANNCYVFGWGDVYDGKAHTKDPRGYSDHAFQAQVVLPAMLEEFVINRWNKQCFTAATSGLSGPTKIDPSAIVRCRLGRGLEYKDGQVAVDFFPELQPDTSVPPNPGCPTPPPGAVIVGTPSDPCAYVGGDSATDGGENAGDDWFGKLIVGAASAAGGYLLMRRWSR